MMAYIKKEPLCAYLENMGVSDIIIGRIESEAHFPTADVVPRAEVEKWHHEYHAIKDELKQEKMYHRETEKLADKYCAELQTIKTEVAREIFAEIEFDIHQLMFERDETRAIAIEGVIANLKKKYTEENK